MKSIAVISDSTTKRNHLSVVGEKIKANLLEVFADVAIVNTYYFDELDESIELYEDAVLIMAGSRANMARPYVKNPQNIILAKRTFNKRGIQPLYNIPVNTDVLVVNDNIETVLDTSSALYSIGIRHLNLIPFDDEKKYDDIHFALSPAEEDLIPENIEHKYNVGARVLDISTMLLIMKKLELKEEILYQRLLAYKEKITPSNEAVSTNFEELLTRTEELDFLLDLSNDGILLTDTEGKILIHNKKFNEIFDLKKPQMDLYLQDILKSLNFEKYYHKPFVDDLIAYNNKEISFEKRNIRHTNNALKMYFCFQEVTHIRRLEQNLSQKLRHQGHMARYTFKDIITDSNEMLDIINRSEKIACSDLTVLITGESGTGKEVLAQAIHNASNRKNQPFIAINAAAIPDNLLESELFGYTKGSFTGALKEGKRGYFEMANNGTIFLDEIGDLPYHLQSKLLRVLQEQQITPIGSDSIIEVNVRVIAATHKNIIEMVESGKFRKDLFYRLNVFPLELPPLKDRKTDIKLLMNKFTNDQYTFTDGCMDLLYNYNWPGNIREVNNVASYIMTIETANEVSEHSLPHYLQPKALATAVTSNPSFQKEWDILNEKHDIHHAMKVLNTIKFFNSIKKTAGRNHIVERVNSEKKCIGENQVRLILTTLNTLELITIKRGRAGNHITDKGHRFLSVHL